MDAIDSFFTGRKLSRQIFEAVRLAIQAIGAAEMKVSRSQVAFRRRVNFAILWMPGVPLRRKAAPLVLTLSFRERDASPRWKQIVEAAPGRISHHLELYSPVEVDREVSAWLRAAWEAAG
jgi:predicted transport protein